MIFFSSDKDKFLGLIKKFKRLNLAKRDKYFDYKKTFKK